jgi:hypothetical protein
LEVILDGLRDPLAGDDDRRLPPLLDGTRDRPALAAQLRIPLEQPLQRLAGHRLISR